MTTTYSVVAPSVGYSDPAEYDTRAAAESAAREWERNEGWGTGVALVQSSDGSDDD